MSETRPKLHLFNSLTRQTELFEPLHAGEARVYSCGPTVYNYQHIGNMRAYIFADTLGRALSHFGYRLTHIINITDVGHLTSDADEGDDKMEKAAAAQGKSAWDIARYYQQVFEDDLARLNIREVQHPRATDYVEAMIEWGKAVAEKHCYELESGLYFDVSTVPDYGRLARAVTDDGEGRIDTVDGKRNPQDFAIWRKTPPGETRQMEWDSPWGRGAPGWHLECSVMSAQLLGHPFDIHTGGIDHREIHHPNEIAQNQAHGCCDDSGARIWMHNNFLIDRRGKMSKSAGEFLTLQALVDRGFHPLAYRLLCLQAHYRSELEFSWDNLLAAQIRLKRMGMGAVQLDTRMEKRSRGDRPEPPQVTQWRAEFDAAIAEDLNTCDALTVVEKLLGAKKVDAFARADALSDFGEVLGLKFFYDIAGLPRVRPKSAMIDEQEIEHQLDLRQKAKQDKNFPAADAIRDELISKGVELMDGNPKRWDWKIDI